MKVVLLFLLLSVVPNFAKKFPIPESALRFLDELQLNTSEMEKLHWQPIRI